MTNRDMVKNADPAMAKPTDGTADRPAADRHAAGSPAGTSKPDEQFPPSEDPLDSNQLKPMINAKQHPGLKREPS